MLTTAPLTLDDEFEKIIVGILNQGYGYSDHILSQQEIQALTQTFEARQQAGEFRPTAILLPNT